MRIRVIFLAALLLAVSTAGVGAGAVLLRGPVGERLVEGHTVFTVIQPVVKTTTEARFAAAVAVLVREMDTAHDFGTMFPGVLWFNDQYLVDPTEPPADVPDKTARYPCSGAIIAVNQGDAPPLTTNGTTGFDNTTPGITYVGSYLITDPNDHRWNVDKWNNSGSIVWTVPILNVDSGYGQPDDGTRTCPAVADRGGCELVLSLATCQPPPVGSAGSPLKNPGTNGKGYPCTSCAKLLYNAVLFMELQDLTIGSTPKNHTIGSTNYNQDAAGCSQNAADYPCPNKDDNREGNSHPYNGNLTWPLITSAGRDNHGGSADCTGDGVSDADCHATRQVDIYYGTAYAPKPRTYLLPPDLQGGTAPYHCNPGPTEPYCSQSEFTTSTFDG